MRTMSAAPRAIVAETGLYIHTTAYSVVLGGLIVLVPLYIISLGYNPGWLGVIIAGQGLFQVAVRLFGGVISDRIGERWVIQASFAALVMGSLGLALSPTLFALLLAQVLFGASRAIYWTSSQSYGSRIDESRPTTLMGRFFGFAAVGGLAGNAGGGFVAVVLGYQEGFLIAGGISAGAMLVVAVTPQLPRRAAMTLREILGPVPGVFRNRATVLPAGMALATSVQVAALSSVGAALYKEFGFDDDAFGALMAIHAFGAIIAGFAFARFLDRVGQRPTYALTLVTHGLPLIAVVLWGGDYAVAVVLMFILGLSFNAGRVLNVSLSAIASNPEQRGVFMAVVGIYWASGQMLGPLLFGPLAALTSLSASVTVMGAVMIGTALLTPLLYAASGGKGESRAESTA